MESNRFDLGYCKLDQPSEHIFLSVTDGFEHGPGIHRDGFSEPWMLDPHGVQHIRKHRGTRQPKMLRRDSPNPNALRAGATTTNPYVQRAGTWTVYHHLERFVAAMEAKGEEWRIVGAQSN